MPRRWKRGVGPSKRGRHKKYHSGETKRWLKLMRAEKRARLAAQSEGDRDAG
jgi:hypothetical protein